MAKETTVTEHVMYTTDTEKNIGKPFIDFTVCPAYESSYKEDILEYYGLEKKFIITRSFICFDTR